MTVSVRPVGGGGAGQTAGLDLDTISSMACALDIPHSSVPPSVKDATSLLLTIAIR